MHLPNTLTNVDVLAQGKEALRSAEFVRKIFCIHVSLLVFCMIFFGGVQVGLGRCA